MLPSQTAVALRRSRGQRRPVPTTEIVPKTMALLMLLSIFLTSAISRANKEPAHKTVLHGLVLFFPCDLSIGYCWRVCRSRAIVIASTRLAMPRSSNRKRPHECLGGPPKNLPGNVRARIPDATQQGFRLIRLFSQSPIDHDNRCPQAPNSGRCICSMASSPERRDRCVQSRRVGLPHGWI